MSTDSPETDTERRVTVQTPPPLRGQTPASADGSSSDRREPSSEEEPASSEATSSLAQTLLWGLGGAGLLALGGYAASQARSPAEVEGRDFVRTLRQSRDGQKLLQERIQTQPELEQLKRGRFPRPALIDWMSQTPAGRQVLREWGWPIRS